MKFRFTFEGRRTGAIGMSYRITAECEGVDMEAARLKLYDKFEDIRIIEVEKLDA